MKVIKFNKKRFIKDLDFISRNRKSNFSNKVNIVKKILKDVKTRGDDAIIYYQKKFDKSSVSKKNIILSDKEINKVIRNLDPSIKSSIKLAFERVKDFHVKQSIKSYKYFDKYQNELAYRVSKVEPGSMQATFLEIFEENLPKYASTMDWVREFIKLATKTLET